MWFRSSFMRSSGYRFGYNRKAGKYVEYEAVIQDVCLPCNRDILGPLDAYGSRFVRENRCDRRFTKRPRLLVYYEYDLLLRWLIKLFYNAVRWAGRSDDVLQRSVGFARGVGPLPSQAAILMEIIRDEIVPEEEAISYGLSTRPISADRIRLGWAGLGDETGPISCRFLGINAFYLFVALAPDEAS